MTVSPSSEVKYFCIVNYKLIILSAEALSFSFWTSKCGSAGKSESFKGYSCPNVKATSCFRHVHANILL